MIFSKWSNSKIGRLFLGLEGEQCILLVPLHHPLCKASTQLFQSVDILYKKSLKKNWVYENETRLKDFPVQYVGTYGIMLYNKIKVEKMQFHTFLKIGHNPLLNGEIFLIF